MPTYVVRLKIEGHIHVQVEAEDEDDAVAVALDNATNETMEWEALPNGAQVEEQEMA